MTAEFDIEHGQLFDDNRRWCKCCQRPTITAPPIDTDKWQHMICPVCTSLWPEYEEEILQSILSDELGSELL